MVYGPWALWPACNPWFLRIGITSSSSSLSTPSLPIASSSGLGCSLENSPTPALAKVGFWQSGGLVAAAVATLDRLGMGGAVGIALGAAAVELGGWFEITGV
jgi:hypothetical protein